MEETPQGPATGEAAQPEEQPEQVSQPETSPSAETPPEPPTPGLVPPPPPPPQPAETPEYTPPPAVAQPKRPSNKKWWFIGCGCLLALCIVVVIASALLGYGIFTAISNPVAPIKGQLAALNQGMIEKAYNDYTSREFRNATSFDAFKKIVDEHPEIFKSRSSSFSRVNVEGNKATVEGSITGQDGTVTRMRYKLVMEDSEWKIQSFEQL